MRSQEDQEDYGIDYEIEVTTRRDAATGFIFKVQQKGVAKADYLADGSAATYSLSTERLGYYLEDMRIPVLLVLVDLEADAVYWRRLQGDTDVEGRFRRAREAGHETVRVHLPIAHRLPQSERALLAAVERTFDYITVAQIRRMPLPSVAEIITSDDDLNLLEQRLGVVKAERARRLVEKGSLDEALEICRTGLEDESQAVETRFQLGLYGEQALMLKLKGSDNPRAKEILLNQSLSVARRLLEISWPRSVSAHLRHYALALVRSARVAIRADSDLGLAMSLRVQRHTSDPYIIATTVGAQRRSTLAMLRELRFAQVRVVRLLRGGWLHLASSAWARLVEATLLFLRRLRLDGPDDALVAIAGWFDATGSLVRAAAESNGSREEIEQWVGANLLIGAERGDFDARKAACSESVAKISDTGERRIAEARLRDVGSRVTDQREPNRSEELPKLYARMARGLGVDLDDPNDEIAHIVRIGIADINPERVVRQCEHIGVRLGSSGIPAEMLGLPTAGSKYVRCRKHGYQVYGLELDSIYAFFRSSYCDSCGDRSKRAEHWNWSHDWQRSQELAWPPEFETQDPFSGALLATEDDSAASRSDPISSEAAETTNSRGTRDGESGEDPE
jgi:hypothetical protein